MKIFLIGFMGSGKSHWGKIWAGIHKLSFSDLDEVIETTEKKAITKIFEEKGEEYFREIESATLHSLANHENIIIACGGGTPCFHDNMEWMNKNGVTVYLKATPEQLVKRLGNEKQKRPILKNVHDSELENFIEEKLKGRESFYNQAKIILDIENITVETFKKIVNFQL